MLNDVLMRNMSYAELARYDATVAASEAEDLVEELWVLEDRYGDLRASLRQYLTRYEEELPADLWVELDDILQQFGRWYGA